MGVWELCSQRGPGAEPVVKGSGGRSHPEAETLLTFEHLMDTANLLCDLKFGNLKNQILRLFCQKSSTVCYSLL